jgi:hypothetical protein
VFQEKEKFMHVNFCMYQGSVQDVNVCVCCGGRSFAWSKIKEDIFCKFYMTTLPYFLPSKPPEFPCDEEYVWV